MPKGERTSDRLKQELCIKKGANNICTKLNLECDNIDFNDDDTGSAGFIEKILLNLP